jgi:hypothetical protein
MPGGCGHSCMHDAAIVATHSVFIVRDFGVAGAISLATASVLGVRSRRLAADTGGDRSERSCPERDAASSKNANAPRTADTG